MTLKNIWRFCTSIELCLGLLALVCVVMAAGSFQLTGDYAAAINAMPLLVWLREVPFGASWWLWLIVIGVSMSPGGMPTGFSGELVTDLRNPAERVTISPNHPWFSGGYGVYIKQAEGYPSRRALLEIHREPGAGMALAGALIFTVGNVLVVWMRSRSKESGLVEDGQ